MKKGIAVLLAVSLLCSLTACGSHKDNNEDSTSPDTIETNAPEDTTEEVTEAPEEETTEAPEETEATEETTATEVTEKPTPMAEITMKVGEKQQLTPSVNGCIYQSNKPLVAKVDIDGLVEGLGIGTAEIIVQAPDGAMGVVKVQVMPAETQPPATTTAPPETTTEETTTTTVTEEKIFANGLAHVGSISFPISESWSHTVETDGEYWYGRDGSMIFLFVNKDDSFSQYADDEAMYQNEVGKFYMQMIPDMQNFTSLQKTTIGGSPAGTWEGVVLDVHCKVFVIAHDHCLYFLGIQTSENDQPTDVEKQYNAIYHGLWFQNRTETATETVAEDTEAQDMEEAMEADDIADEIDTDDGYEMPEENETEAMPAETKSNDFSNNSGGFVF